MDGTEHHGFFYILALSLILCNFHPHECRMVAVPLESVIMFLAECKRQSKGEEEVLASGE